MERGSDKHAPWADERMKAELDAPVLADGLESPAPDDHVPEPGRRPLGEDTGAGLTEEEVDLRAMLAAAVTSAEWPARTDQLIEVAQEAGAPDTVVNRLHLLPDQVFDNVQQVWETSGGTTEPPHTKS